MIRFADNQTAPLVRQMWKTCFGDSEEFMNLYFNRKYRNENTLVYFESETAVASMQMLPYTMRFYGSVISVAYVSGACTLPECRGKGYMKKLLLASFKVMQERNILLSILVPAENWLYDFYAKLGYEKIFDRSDKDINMHLFLSHYPANTKIAYATFNKEHQQQDFCVLKSMDDFEVIMEDYVLHSYSAKYNLEGMARIIDAGTMLELYAKKNKTASFTLKIIDELTENNEVYKIGNGIASKTKDAKFDIESDIHLLTRLLFGYRIQELSPVYNAFFSEHHPVMNLMLE